MKNDKNNNLSDKNQKKTDLNKKKSISSSQTINKKSTASYYSNYSSKHIYMETDINEEEKKTKREEFIFILDISKSMGDYVNQILKSVMPKVFKKLKFDKKKIVHLITFSDITQHSNLTVKDFEIKGINKQGDTQMMGVIEKLKEIIYKCKENDFINILFLSDGLVRDEKETKNQIDSFLIELQSKNYKYINTKGIRFISGNMNDKPDTKILCSLIQLNSDISQKDILPVEFNPEQEKMDDDKIEKFSEIIYGFFLQKSGYKIKYNKKIFSLELNGEEYDEIDLPKGKSDIFINEDPNKIDLKELIISNEINELDKINKGDVSLNNYHKVYKNYLDKTIEQIIQNKIVESNEKNKKIIADIKDIRDKLIEDNKGEYITDEKNIVNILEEINKDDSVKNMDNLELGKYIDKKKKESKNDLEMLIQLSNFEIFYIIDSCEEMKNDISYLVNTILYQFSKRVFNEKKKINILSFNSKEKPLEELCIVQKLNEFEISNTCQGDREVCDYLEYIIEYIRENQKTYILFFFFSGKIKDKDIKDEDYLEKLKNKINEINHKKKIHSRIIKFIRKNDDSDFKNPNNVEKIYESIFNLNTQKKSYKPLILNSEKNVKDLIEQLTDLIKI